MSPEELGEVTIGLVNDRNPVEFATYPYRLFVLLGLIQVALTHPALETDTPEMYRIAIELYANLKQALLTVCPYAEPLVLEGENRDKDMTKAEFDAFMSQVGAWFKDDFIPGDTDT